MPPDSDHALSMDGVKAIVAPYVTLQIRNPINRGEPTDLK